MPRPVLAAMFAVLMFNARAFIPSPSLPASPQVFPAEQKWSSGSDWGSGEDASLAFTPDGRTLFFTHSIGNKRAIMVSHLVQGDWSQPAVAPFSGNWMDREPVMSPDGSYLIFVSNRPATEGGSALDGYFGGAVRPGWGGNLWRVNRTQNGWSEPTRLPDIVNSHSAIYSPAVAGNGNLYFNQPDPKTKKTRLYWSQFTNGRYQAPEPLSFTDGVTSDYDAVVAPDESFMIFSSNRPPTPEKQAGIFITFSDRGRWGTPVPFEPTLLGIECRLSPDLKTLYFTSDQPTLGASPKPSTAITAQTSQVIWQVPLRKSSR